jgi:3',5'-cyclic AMP phosphodiesterase CpdA
MLTACYGQENKPAKESGFSFVFLTDIHLQNKRGACDAFQLVIDTVNKLDVDFVMTGGDLVFDVMRGNLGHSDSLFKLYMTYEEKFSIPVYHAIGNHELFGIYPESNVDSLHSDYKYGMFERYFGDTYYSFNHKHWHFIVLNSLMVKDKVYYGMIDKKQKSWLQQDIALVDSETPIAVITHIPMITMFYHLNSGDNAPNGMIGVRNYREILALFEKHNLKLVLQGHLHWLEDINVRNKTRFITGGAVAGRPSWRGAKYNEEGFLKNTVDEQNDISWQYIDYGWNAETQSRVQPQEQLN